jgi:hypothetical protein
MITIGPATADTCQSGAVAAGPGQTCGITVTLKAITFLADHEMHENADPGTWGAGDALLPPDWQDVNSADNAISYTRGASLQMQVRVEIEASGIETPTLRVTGPDGIQGTSGVTSACGTNQRTVTITTTPLPNYVNRYEPMMLDWSFQRQGETTWTAIRATTHQIFVSYDTPTFDDPVSGPPTQRRMQWVCGAGLDSAALLWITDRIHVLLDTQPPLDGQADPAAGELWANDWKLMSGFPYLGECHDQAHLMNLMLKILGLPSGNEYLTFASTDANPTDEEFTTAAALGITEDLDKDGQVGDETLELKFLFDPNNQTDPGVNNFEGSIFVPAVAEYYAVWPNLAASSACGLLLQIGTTTPFHQAAKQAWVYTPTLAEYVLGARMYVHYPVVPFPTCP